MVVQKAGLEQRQIRAIRNVLLCSAFRTMDTVRSELPKAGYEVSFGYRHPTNARLTEEEGLEAG